MVTAGAQRGSAILWLPLPAAQGDAWVWVRRLLLLVGGTAAAWFLLLMVSGQAHAAPPPDPPSLAAGAPNQSHAPQASEDSLAVAPVPVDCAPISLNSEQPSPASVAVGVPDLSALDQLTGQDVAGPAAPDAGNGHHAQAALGRLVALVTTSQAGERAPTTRDVPLTSPPRDMAAKAHSAASVLSRPAAHGSGRPVAHGMQSDQGVVRAAGGTTPATPRVEPSVATPISSSVPPSSAAAFPRDAGPAPLLPPPPPGPCAGTSTTTVSGSGGSDRFDALSTLGIRLRSAPPAGSTAMPSGTNGDAIRGQARPEPRPD